MLVKLAYAMQRLKNIFKKIVMINKDGGGGQFLDFVGAQLLRGGTYSSWGSPHWGNPGEVYFEFMHSII